jgi:hypothetical protein
MAREMPVGNGQFQTVRLIDHDYWLVPMTESGTRQQTRAQRSELQIFNSSNLNSIKEFEYEKLTGSKKSVRLLQLRSGTTHGPEIFCELIEADYSNSFHIPTKPDDSKQGAEDNMTVEEKLLKEYEKVKANEIEYEALSWCWGTDPPDYAVMIQHNGVTYKKRVKKELALALKYLRLPNQTRTLWIDAICIYPIRSRLSCRQKWRCLSQLFFRNR